jgi:hypothetical protein
MSQTGKTEYRNTVGSIVSWAIIRAMVVILVSLLLYEYMHWVDYGLWWTVTALALYAVVIHPMQVQYRMFREETREVMEGTLCSSCKYFEETGVLCSKLDEHVTEDRIPCEGQLWEPRQFDDD